jgi:tetratricopeptide (TPR) repeat protein
MKTAIDLKLRRIVELNSEHISQRDSSSPISLHDGTEDIEAFSRTVKDIMNSSSIKSDSFSQNPSSVNIMSSSYLASSDFYRGFFPLQHNGKESGGRNRFPDYHDLMATQNTAWGNQRVIEGIAAAREEKYETAIEFCNAALSVLPNSVQAFVCRGASYASISKYERAFLDFERALELDPLNQNAKQYLNKILGKEQRVTPVDKNTIILPVESAQTRMVFAERHMYPSRVKTKDVTRGPLSSSSSKVEDDSNSRSGAVDTVNGYTFEREDRGDSSDNDSQISTSTKKRKREKEGKHRKSSSSKNEKVKKNRKHKDRKKHKKEKNDST